MAPIFQATNRLFLESLAPTGSELSGGVVASPVSRSRCERFREVILSKREQGLDSQRIYQDLVEEHGFEEKYRSVHRFVKSLGESSALPFRRIEVEPCGELQMEFGLGRPCKDHSGALRKTHVFRALLSFSRR